MIKIFILSESLTRKDWQIIEHEILGDETIEAYMLGYDYARFKGPESIKNKVQSLEQFINYKDYNKINKNAFLWSNNWYKNTLISRNFKYRGLNIGSLVEFPIFNYVNTLLRIDLIVKNLIKEKKPNQVHVFLNRKKFNSWSIDNKVSFIEMAFIRHIKKIESIECIDRSVFFTSLYYNIFDNVRARLKSLKKILTTIQSRFDNNSYNKNKNHGPNVIFLGSGHSMYEIAERYIESNYGDVNYITSDNAIKSVTYDNCKITPINFNSCIPFFTTLSDVRFFFRINKLLKKILNDNKLNKLVNESEYLNIFFLKTFIHFFKCEGLSVLKKIRCADDLLKATNTSLVFTDNSQQTLERIFLLLARKRKILTIESAHSLCNNIFYPGFPEFFITDYYFVWGKRDRVLFENLGADQFMLEEVGAGRLSNYIGKEGVKKQGKYKIIIGVTCDLEHKFYGMTGFGNLRDHIHVERYKHLIELAKIDTNIFLSFKFRNGTHIKKDYYLYSLLKKAGVTNYNFVQNFPVSKWINSISLMITDYSTLGIESMILNKPVIIHRSEFVIDALGYESSGAVDVVDPDLGNLSRVVYNVANNPDRRKKQRHSYAKYCLGDLNDLSSDRVTSSELYSKIKLFQSKKC
jgi:hypothetical protein